MGLEFLWQGVLSITPQQVVMYVVGGLLIWLAIEKGFEPALLMPMGFGCDFGKPAPVRSYQPSQRGHRRDPRYHPVAL